MQSFHRFVCSRSTTPKPSGSLHAQITNTVRDLRFLALDTVETVAAQTGTRVNRLAPLDHLADDTLALILLHLDNRTTFFTTKVSRRWRNLVLSTPSLWSNIDLSLRDNFRDRFQLFEERSQNVPLDVKLVLESSYISTDGIDKDDADDLIAVWSDCCEFDVRDQLERYVGKQVLAPYVLARLRTLDITSMLSTDPHNYGYDLVEQPTPTLYLPACSSLRRLRLNWARPGVHELLLNLEGQDGAFDSVDSLALCAIVNLQEVLPRFPGVIDLSLWLGNLAHNSNDFQLADIFAWMPQLRKLEIAEVPVSFASKAFTSSPSLDRLCLHGKYARDVLATIASQMNINKIPEISLWNNDIAPWNNTNEALPIISASSGPAAELSVFNYQNPIWPRMVDNFCTDDGRGHRRIFHAMKCRSECDAEIVSYTTVNTNADALYSILLNVMPQLVTLRVWELNGVFLADTGRRPQISCPGLANLELYVAKPVNRSIDAEVVMSGADIRRWVECHLKDFSQPLDTLRLVGLRVGSDLNALDGLARNVLFAPTRTSLIQYVPYHLAVFAHQIQQETYMRPITTGRRAVRGAASWARKIAHSNSSFYEHTRDYERGGVKYPLPQ